MASRHDIVIVEAGIAGSSSAIARAPEGYRILLLDQVRSRHSGESFQLQTYGMHRIPKHTAKRWNSGRNRRGRPTSPCIRWLANGSSRRSLVRGDQGVKQSAFTLLHTGLSLAAPMTAHSYSRP